MVFLDSRMLKRQRLQPLHLQQGQRRKVAIKLQFGEALHGQATLTK